MHLRLTQGLQRAKQLRSQNVALIDGAHQFTWDQLTDRIARLAAGFRKNGLKQGDRVAFLALNSHRSLECFYAAIWAGGIITPLNHRLAETEIAALVHDAEPSIFVVGSEFTEIAQSIDLPITIHAGDKTPPKGMISYEDLITECSPLTEGDRGGEDVACIFYTGGTTGTPKGVMLTHNNIMANTLNVVGPVAMSEKTVHLHCGPLFHVAAAVRLFSVTHVAGTHVMLPRFALPDVLETIQTHKITLATFVPTMLRNILDQPNLSDYDLTSMRYITYGAAPMPETLLRELMTRLPHIRFLQSYGMTELSPVATMLGPEEHADPSGKYLRSAGRAAILAEVRIVDPNDTDMPTGEYGEIIVRGPMVMAGYWHQPEATAQALRGGWMHTGDIGYLDKDGYLFVVDRLKDMIITGGENVYSQEVENIISQLAGVKECAVFGLPDPQWGERIHAVVRPAENTTLDAETVIAHCKALLAGFKCPKSVDIRTTPLPLSGANKILKTTLREEALASQADTKEPMR